VGAGAVGGRVKGPCARGSFHRSPCSLCAPAATGRASSVPRRQPPETGPGGLMS
jgi:hypothetical protein